MSTAKRKLLQLPGLASVDNNFSFLQYLILLFQYLLRIFYDFTHGY